MWHKQSFHTLLVGVLIGKTTGKKIRESPKIEPGHVLYDPAVPLVNTHSTEMHKGIVGNSIICK